MRRAWLVGTYAVLGCSRADAGPQPSGSAKSHLVGTWRAVEYTRGPDDARTYPFGRPPRGYIVYDATGHVFFQVASAGQSAPPRDKGWNQADTAALHQMLRSASAYFGTYSVDASRGTVTHRIEGEIPPLRSATEVATPFEIRGDTLALSSWLFLRVR
jgi:hypothetical protein